jgi:hypothetical protein
LSRPTEYQDKYDKMAYKLCLLGSTDKQMADIFEVSEQTLNTWKQKHPSFLESLKKGKDLADAQVTKSLFQRARGYKHKEDKIFIDKGTPIIVPTVKHYPPDTLACIYWLNNRQRDKWKNTVEVDGVENYVPPVPRKVEYEQKVHPTP